MLAASYYNNFENYYTSSTNASTISSIPNLFPKKYKTQSKLFPKMNTYSPTPTKTTKSRSIRLDIIKEDFPLRTPSTKPFHLKSSSALTSSLSNNNKNSRNRLSMLNNINKTEISFHTQQPTVKKAKKKSRTLTLQGIEEEIQNLHRFIQTSPCRYSKDYIREQLHLKTPKVKEGKSNFNNFVYKNQAIIRLRSQTGKHPKKRKHSQNEKDPKWKQFVKMISNPSYGIDGIKKQFPKLTTNNAFLITSTFHSRYRTSTLGSTMIASRIDTKAKDPSTFDSTRKKQLTQASRLKLKCKMIRWFMDNKKDLLSRLLDPHFKEQILKFTEKKSKEFNVGLTIEDFSTLMQNNLITSDPELIQKLFWIIDEKGDNDLNYSEIVSGIEMFRDSTPEEKIRIFFRLCDTDNSNTVSRKKFYSLLQSNLINRNDVPFLKKSVEKIFAMYKDQGDELTLEQFVEGFKANKDLENVINNNMLALKTIDKVIDEDVKKGLMMFNAEQNMYIQQKIFGGNYESCRIRDRRFGNMLTGFIKAKEEMAERRKQRENEEDFISDEGENHDDTLRRDEEEAFKNERDIYKMLMDMNKTNPKKYIQ